MVVEIPLKSKENSGRFALVDETDAVQLRRFEWRYFPMGYTGYAVRSEHTTNGVVIHYMHRLLCGLAKGDKREIDHINGNGLDNRRVNLRITDRSGNMRNRRRFRNNTTGEKNVDLRANGRYRLTIRGRHRGLFPTLREAAARRDELLLTDA